ncbi:hypothetical protein [Streptomyces kanamyceticus]|uniref:DUF8017 domain-containing protein n=1 Tax=Streptomyces kanamyceticus TaxID=1967 RepID=A0A5J6GNG5_STRKN|nr:hypothetical protein [Streptomyces kanamyceticus]QEU95914.1 hypothetical protein CP970_37790 [Streptomyces kanamyceticus]
MWPGQQPPGGEQNPRDQSQNPYQQPGYQQPNPYQQPGYQQPGYQQPGHQAPSPYQQPAPGDGGQGAGDGGQGGPGDRGRSKVIPIVAAAAVLVAAGVTGFLVLGGDKDDEDTKADSPAGSAAKKPDSTPGTDGGGSDGSDGSDGDSERGTDNGLKPTVKGWRVVVNPKWGTAFDVPPEWDVQNPGSAIALEDHKTGKPLMTMSAPAYLKPKWCVADDNKDGKTEDHELAAVGTKGANGAKNTDEVAVNQVSWWIYGVYTQPDKKSLGPEEKPVPYTTKSGIKGSISRAKSVNTPMKGKCATDGKAISFGFKNAAGEYVVWSLYGATGVKDEIPEETVMKILSTVRTQGDPTES